MYFEKPTVTHKISDNLLALIVIVCSLAMVVVSNMVSYYSGSSIPGFATFIAYAAACYFLYNRRLVEYRYGYGENHVLFDRVSGKRSKPLRSVPVKSVRALLPFDEYTGDVRKLHRLTKLEPSTGYVLVVDGDADILFHPSDKLARLISGLERLESEPDDRWPS